MRQIRVSKALTSVTMPTSKVPTAGRKVVRIMGRTRNRVARILQITTQIATDPPGSHGAWYGGASPGTWGGYYAGMAAAGAAGLAIGATVASLPALSTPIVVQGNPYYYSGDVYYAPQGNGYAVVPPPKGAVVPSVPAVKHRLFFISTR